uniref:Alpha-S1-casein n=1 Tax=Oryctolagus cuniculus TaxID=9986 RepID=A0A5S8HCZ7_RABIT
MKLLILTCLVATALARHKFHLGHLKLTQEQPESSEQEILKERKLLRFVQTVPLELREEYVNELNRQRELLREKENEEIKGTRNEVTEEHVLADREVRYFILMKLIINGPRYSEHTARQNSQLSIRIYLLNYGPWNKTYICM